MDKLSRLPSFFLIDLVEVRYAFRFSHPTMFIKYKLSFTIMVACNAFQYKTSNSYRNSCIDFLVYAELLHSVKSE